MTHPIYDVLARAKQAESVTNSLIDMFNRGKQEGADAMLVKFLELLRSEEGRKIFRNNSHGVACNLLEKRLRVGGA